MSEPAVTPPPVSPVLQQALICASIQTYKAYIAGDAFPGDDPMKFIGNPKGWTYVEAFYGQDVFDKQPIHKLVLFGLVFRADDDGDRYLVAFRGTKGIHEWIDDADVPKTAFAPFQSGSGPEVPSDVLVEDGFWKIYDSLRTALFGMLDEWAPTSLAVTGHSLGSSLATLFTLDATLSRPSWPLTSCNFACPRSGNRAFADFYDEVTTQHHNPALRVVNTKDIVPRLPPKALGYHHAGPAEDICFESPTGVLPSYGLRHSADNYARTLAHKFGTEVDCKLEGSTPVPLKFC